MNCSVNAALLGLSRSSDVWRKILRSPGEGGAAPPNVDAGALDITNAVIVNADDYFYLSAVTLYGDLRMEAAEYSL